MSRIWRLIGVGLCFIAVVGIFWWEGWGRNATMRHDILVVSSSLGKDTMITDEDIDVINVNRKFPEALDATDKKNIIGKHLNRKISKGSPLYATDFRKRNKQVMDEIKISIPSKYLQSEPPEDLSNLDKAYIYADGELVMKCNLWQNKRSNGDGLKIRVDNDQARAISSLIANGHNMIVGFQDEM